MNMNIHDVCSRANYKYGNNSVKLTEKKRFVHAIQLVSLQIRFCVYLITFC